MIKKGSMDLESVHISDNAKDLLKKMIIYDRDKRLTFVELYEHPFFNRKK